MVDAADGVRVTVDGNTLVSFSSNDYLGLASHPAIAQSFAEAARLPFDLTECEQELIAGRQIADR